MLNQVVMVGRVTKDVELKTNKQDKEYANITLAIPKSHKNEDGEYDTDFVPVTLWNAVAKNTAEYVKKGDLIGIKGTVTGTDNKIYITAERVTFLSTKKD